MEIPPVQPGMARRAIVEWHARIGEDLSAGRRDVKRLDRRCRA